MQSPPLAVALPREVLEIAGVYLGGVMGGVRIVEKQRGECCTLPELSSDCIEATLREERWGDLAHCVGSVVEHMGCANCGKVCTITLCPHLIDAVAADIAKQFDLEVQVVATAVRELVIAHEFAHCFMGCLSKMRRTARLHLSAAPWRSPGYVVYRLVEESLATALEYLYYLYRFGNSNLAAPLQRMFSSLPPGYAGYMEWLKTVFVYNSLSVGPMGASSMTSVVQLLDPFLSAVQWATCHINERPSHMLPPLFRELFDEGLRKYHGTPINVVVQAHKSYSGIRLWFKVARRIGLVGGAQSIMNR